MFRSVRILRIVCFAGALGLGALSAQSPEATRKLVQKALAADDAAFPALAAELDQLPPLSKADAATWTEFVRKAIAKSAGPKLESAGVSYFYDAGDKKNRKGKYMVSGAGNKKGLVFGLHGGGVGSADCGPASSAFRGAVSAAGMIGIYPEAIEATEAAWGDDVTVKFMHDLLAAARRTWTFDPERIYVIGHSMGGYGAWTWGGRFSDRLAGVVSFAGSPTPIFQDGDRSKAVIAIQDGVLPNLRNVPIRVYHSVDDKQVPFPSVKFAVTELKRLAVEHPGDYALEYEEVPNRGHDFPAKGVGPSVEWITAKARIARPKRITWQAFYPRADASYWLWWEHPRQGQTLEATWKVENGVPVFRIEGDATTKEEVAVLLDDAMVDLDRPVKVLLRDQVVFDGTPKRSLSVLVKSARRRSDPGLLFTARAG